MYLPKIEDCLPFARAGLSLLRDRRHGRASSIRKAADFSGLPFEEIDAALRQMGPSVAKSRPDSGSIYLGTSGLSRARTGIDSHSSTLRAAIQLGVFHGKYGSCRPHLLNSLSKPQLLSENKGACLDAVLLALREDVPDFSVDDWSALYTAPYHMTSLSKVSLIRDEIGWRFRVGLADKKVGSIIWQAEGVKTLLDVCSHLVVDESVRTHQACFSQWRYLQTPPGGHDAEWLMDRFSAHYETWFDYMHVVQHAAPRKGDGPQTGDACIQAVPNPGSLNPNAVEDSAAPKAEFRSDHRHNRRSPNSACFLYIIASDSNSVRLKVGISADADNRARQLSTFAPVTVLHRWALKRSDATIVESALHRLLSPFRTPDTSGREVYDAPPGMPGPAFHAMVYRLCRNLADNDGAVLTIGSY